MPKNTTYELRLTGLTDDAGAIINLLVPILPPTYPTIAAANAKRRAIGELFGDAVQMDVVSVRRVPAKTVRRVLRV